MIALGMVPPDICLSFASTKVRESDLCCDLKFEGKRSENEGIPSYGRRLRHVSKDDPDEDRRSRGRQPEHGRSRVEPARRGIVRRRGKGARMGGPPEYR